MSDRDRDPVAVLLLNLGGPDSPAAVAPFLYNLFSDREIIRLGPSLLQKPIAWLISRLRSQKTRDAYNLIGGKSPILEITRLQAAALEAVLDHTAPCRVFVGMRYWHPFTEDVVAGICQEGMRRCIALTLYPHYSAATTGSSFSALDKAQRSLQLEVRRIRQWYDHPLYIDALTDVIRKGMALCGSEDTIHVLFSAHSLPVSFIEAGDPYVEHINATIAAVCRKMQLSWSLSYQSKSGPVKWLEPSTEEHLAELSRTGVKNLLVVPISFVSDHIETLYEIDILYRQMAESLGMKMHRTSSLNDHPLFIRALADLVLEEIRQAGWDKNA